MKTKILSVLSSVGAFLLSLFGGACGPLCFLTGCCGGTAIFGLFGVSSTMMGYMKVLTPIFLSLTILSLGYAFYVAYKPKKKQQPCCAETTHNESNNCCEEEKKPSFFKSKAFLWIITIICAIMWTYPLISKTINKSEPNQTCCPTQNTNQNSACCGNSQQCDSSAGCCKNGQEGNLSTNCC